MHSYARIVISELSVASYKTLHYSMPKCFKKKLLKYQVCQKCILKDGQKIIVILYFMNYVFKLCLARL